MILTYKITYRLFIVVALIVLPFINLSEGHCQGQKKHLGLRTVVIDPGHGGKDPGALGRTRNMHEKHIVLSVSRLLGQKIREKYPDVKVIYTRSNDTFIGLHERAMVARRNNADLFISIHCNGSSSPDAKGTSVHILGQNSDNKKNKTDYFERNMSTAQRENSVIVLEEDYQTKYQTFDPDSPESFISHQLQWMAYYESSLLFASEVVEHLVAKPLTPRRLVVDQDIFQVLVEANMPAVLLELAFVTNPVEYKFLSSKEGQEDIAERLFKAFSSYKTKFDASVNVQKSTSAVNPVQTPETSEDDSRYYSIQIMGLGRELKSDDPAFKGLKCHWVKSDSSSIYKYMCGKYDFLDQAASRLPDVKKKFPEAFVVEIAGNEIKRIR